jgi:hypothetical protein
MSVSPLTADRRQLKENDSLTPPLALWRDIMIAIICVTSRNLHFLTWERHADADAGSGVPLALSGSEKTRGGAPTQLPEARRAMQAGKLPRQAGMMPVRHDHQYELTLQAETLAVSSAKLQPDCVLLTAKGRLSDSRLSQASVVA